MFALECRRCRRRLPLYVDAELAPGEMEDLRRHLEWCRACRAAEVEMRELAAWSREVLGRAGIAADPPAAAGKQGSYRRPWRAWVTVALVALLAIFAAAAMLCHCRECGSRRKLSRKSRIASAS